MISSFYANNFRSLVNFRLPLRRLTLLLGPNGSGKSAILAAVDRLVRYVSEPEATVEKLFRLDDFTHWQQHVAPVQGFELELTAGDCTFLYALEVRHDPERRKCRMEKETLSCNGRTLFEFYIKDGVAQAQLYHDNFARGPEVLADWSRSGVGALQPRPDNKLLTSFRERLGATIVARPAPQLMNVESVVEWRRPDLLLSEYAGWLAHLLHANSGRMTDVQLRLRDVIPGFRALVLKEAGTAKVLHVEFVGDGERAALRFDALSDGERMLIVLYTILGHLEDGNIVCLDEPENFLALPEVQPWIDALRGVLEKTDTSQVLLVSHHPKMVNFLAADAGVWVSREGRYGPTQWQLVRAEAKSGDLSVAQLVERGWIYDA